MIKCLLRLAALTAACLALGVAGLWLWRGSYGLHEVMRHGGTYWINVADDDPRLSDAMRLALAGPPAVVPGPMRWRRIGKGFDVAALSALADGDEVDRLYLARLDPAHFRFAVRNDSDGARNLDQWMTDLGAALVINGSYYSRYGTPVTPFLSAGSALGPGSYDARAGAFVSSDSFVGVRDLRDETWRATFSQAQDAMVSFPLLVARDGADRTVSDSRWLANRSFVGQDRFGRIVLGMTADGFFSLARFASFLRRAPLGLTVALNLDGGPVACQGIAFNGFHRKVYGRWELQRDAEGASLLAWPFGTVAMPIVLAAYPK
jgi:hypothetical protein